MVQAVFVPMELKTNIYTYCTHIKAHSYTQSHRKMWTKTTEVMRGQLSNHILHLYLSKPQHIQTQKREHRHCEFIPYHHPRSS